MRAYIKSFSAFHTLKSADVLAASLCIASSDGSSSSITVVGEFARSYAGYWLIYDKLIYLIDKVSPEDGRTVFTLLEPIEAFNRDLLYTAPTSTTYTGKWLAEQIDANWTNQPDTFYAMPYLTVSNSDTSAFVSPELDDNGLFNITDYIRTQRLNLGLRCDFSIDGDTLTCSIYKGSTTDRNVVFDDGHSQLSSAAYSKSGLAKITAMHQIDTGNVDANGDAIYTTESKDYYLTESGTITTRVPDVRIDGGWSTIFVSAKKDVETAVSDKFAKNSESHKIEFYSDRELSVYDPCNIKLYGEIMTSYISYKGITSTDSRYLYKSGELATTITDKIRSLSS